MQRQLSAWAREKKKGRRTDFIPLRKTILLELCFNLIVPRLPFPIFLGWSATHLVVLLSPAAAADVVLAVGCRPETINSYPTRMMSEYFTCADLIRNCPALRLDPCQLAGRDGIVIRFKGGKWMVVVKQLDL